MMGAGLWSWVRLLLLAYLALFASGCSSLGPRYFAASRPAFFPERYFEGRTESRGFFETRSGQPSAAFSTKAEGRRDGEGLALHQVFTFADGRQQERRWRVRRLGEHRYEATANDVVGTARGEA
ncbi:MAG: DUF3833 domain-containing protein, partial [Verrucomicrobiota bacterium]|nr:DUF3833 domain-containing protein [Verrucomicrobiota bacterium]